MKCIRKVQTAAGIHLAPYPKGTGSSIPPINWPGSEAVVKNAIATFFYVASRYVHRKIVYFVDRISLYNFVNKSNLVRNVLSMFISFLYMFRATMCPSSGETTVSIRHLVFVTLCG